MAMDDFCNNAVVKNNARLLITGKYSDLTLICQDQRFHVHQSIICARSPVWAAAAEGDFKEGQTKSIDVKIGNADTLYRALMYLYIGSYSDEEPLVRFSDPTARVEHEPSVTEDQSEVVEDASADSDVDSTADSACICKNFEDWEPKHTCKNTRAKINTLVYILADYYEITELKQLAEKKFKSALLGVCPKGLDEVCHLVYEAAPPTALDLRRDLANAIAKDGTQLVEGSAFMATALSLPELSCHLLTAVAEQWKSAANDRDAASAELIVTQSEKEKFKQEQQRNVGQVNKAKQCRHCSLENNVHFEPLGEAMYSLRCRCRTRY